MADATVDFAGLNYGDGESLDCGCIIYRQDDGLFRLEGCTLHGAAPKVAEVLKELLIARRGKLPWDKVRDALREAGFR